MPNNSVPCFDFSMSRGAQQRSFNTTAKLSFRTGAGHTRADKAVGRQFFEPIQWLKCFSRAIPRVVGIRDRDTRWDGIFYGRG